MPGIAFFNVRHLSMLSDNATLLFAFPFRFHSLFVQLANGHKNRAVSVCQQPETLFFLLNIYIYIYIIFFLIGSIYFYFSFRKDIGKDIGIIRGKGKPIRKPFSL